MTAFAKINLITLTLSLKIHQHQPGESTNREKSNRDWQYLKSKILLREMPL